MVDRNVHHGVLCCYDRAIFLYRPKEDKNKHTLIMSKEYSVHAKDSSRELTPVLFAAWFLHALGLLDDAKIDSNLEINNSYYSEFTTNNKSKPNGPEDWGLHIESVKHTYDS